MAMQEDKIKVANKKILRYEQHMDILNLSKWIYKPISKLEFCPLSTKSIWERVNVVFLTTGLGLKFRLCKII